MKRVKIIISGMVHGVAFRASVRNQATLLEVKGYVKNLDSGEVEAVFEGEDQNVDEIIKYCKKGPMMATVERFRIEEEKYENEFKEFEIRYE